MVQYVLRCVLSYLIYVCFMLEMKMTIHKTLDLLILGIFCAQCVLVVAVDPDAQSHSSRPNVENEPSPASERNSSNLTVAESVNGTLSDVANENNTLKNRGPQSFEKTINQIFSIDNGAVKRTFYVVASLTGLVLVYIAVKAIRTSRKRKTRRYGLLIDQEMDPLDADDDDEDTTLFEATKHKKKIKK